MYCGTNFIHTRHEFCFKNYMYLLINLSREEMLEVRTYHPFNNAVKSSEMWIAQIMYDLALENRRAAVRLLRATLHFVRDNFSEEDNDRFVRQLPVVAWQLFFMNDDPLPNRKFAELPLERFARRCSETVNPEADPLKVLKMVLAIVRQYVDHPGIDALVMDTNEIELPSIIYAGYNQVACSW
jgi:uncharacterized protein (DUF2267 family)